MKKIVLNSLLLMVVMLFSSSTNAKHYKPIKKSKIPVKYAFWCSWDEWGRGSSCRGWGLCQLVYCFDCWVDDGIIVGYVANRPGGTITIEEGKKEGIMTIKLNPSNLNEKNAIDNKLSLPIETNLENEKFIAVKGDYLFDSNIGQHGGYIVKVIMK